MDGLTAALLGAVQGATEFLPVSSSGHVSALALLFGLEQMPLSMVIILHVGTLLATLIVMRGDLGVLLKDFGSQLQAPKQFFSSASGKTIFGVLVATIPTGAIGLSIKDQVEKWATIPWVIGACWLLTAAILCLPVWIQKKRKKQNLAERDLTQHPWFYFFLIGVAQGIAVMPGISRSGMTIAAALMLGFHGKDAFRFSFLLSLPAILGALILSLEDFNTLAELGSSTWIGASVSLFVGILCLLWLRRLVEIGKMWIFSLYLLPAAAALITWGTLQ